MQKTRPKRGHSRTTTYIHEKKRYYGPIMLLSHIIIIIILLISIFIIKDYFRTVEKLDSIESKIDLLLSQQKNSAEATAEYLRQIIAGSGIHELNAYIKDINFTSQPEYETPGPIGIIDRFEFATPDIKNDLLQAVVSIYAGPNIGSGFVLTEDGYILTRYDIVRDYVKIESDFYGGTVTFAKLIDTDDANGFALIKVNAMNLHTFDIKKQPALIPGQEIAILGHPKGYDISLSKGTITAISDDGFEFDSHTVDTGNLGGPIVTNDGTLVGIVYESSGIHHKALYPASMDTITERII